MTLIDVVQLQGSGKISRLVNIVDVSDVGKHPTGGQSESEQSSSHFKLSLIEILTG